MKETPGRKSAPAARMAGSPGFTLIEVLVATAIVGIALGVLLAGLGQGHRQAFRGDAARNAASIAESVLWHLAAETVSVEPGEGDVETCPGWRYRVELREFVLHIAAPDQEPAEFEAPEVTEMVLTLLPPAGAPPFVLVSLLPSEDT